MLGRLSVDASWLDRIERQYGHMTDPIVGILVNEIRHLHNEREDLRSALRDNRWELGR